MTVVMSVLAQTLQAGTEFGDHIHFLGRLNHGLLRHIFPCADIAIFPSIIPEAYPLVLMESLSAGVLPAASNFSGFAEGLDQLYPFLEKSLVDQLRLPVDEQHRVAGIALRISKLIEQQQDRSDELRAIAVSHYDWKIRADKPLLRRLSFALKPIFSANHHWAMRKGEESLRLELARRRATTAAERARIPAPPAATTTSSLPLLGGIVLVAGLIYIVAHRATGRNHA